MAYEVVDNAQRQQYELRVDGDLAALTQYRLHGGVADFVHTETLEQFAHLGLATELVRSALDDVRRRGWKVRPLCPFVRRFIAEHGEYRDLVPATEIASFFGEDGSPS